MSHQLNTYLRAPETFVSGRGAELVTADGRVYLDFLAGIAVSGLGHAHPRMVRELSEQLGQLVHTSNLFRHPHAEAVATRLARLTGLEGVFFTNSGTEANEAAIKLARKRAYLRGETQRTGLIALEGSFHGRSMGSLSLTHTEKYRKPFAPLLPNVAFVAPGDTAKLAELLHTRAYGALFVEPIQGEAGVVIPPAGYLQGVRALCNRTNTLMVADEIQSGLGRTGKTFACDHEGVVPDLYILGKALGGGLYPVSAVCADQDVLGVITPGSHGSTFGGNPLACAVANAVLDIVLEPAFLAEVERKGLLLKQQLASLKDRFPDVIEDVRGQGLMAGLKVKPAVGDMIKALTAEHLLAVGAGDNVVRLVPPLIVSDAEIADAVERIGRAAVRVRGSMS